MPDPVQLAKEAREALAAALNALQTNDVPDELVDAAEPVAQAMGVLHRIERTEGKNLEGREDALKSVRSALDRVQKVESPHPAVEKVMDAIAASLSKVHSLVRYTPPAQPAVAPQPVITPQPIVSVQPAIAPQPAITPQPILSPKPVAAPAPVAAPQPVAQARPPITAEVPTQPVAQPPVASAQPSHRVAVTQKIAPQAVAAAQPAAQPRAQAQDPMKATLPSAVPTQQPTPRPSPHVGVGGTQKMPADRPSQQGGGGPQKIPADRPSQTGGANKVVVELGTHSTSTFYKGLGGNDVIEHGGIFVATYKVLKIGVGVTLHVLLPGNYEFNADGVVQWTREGGSAEPGYGVRFTQISAEARQLVYRYTRLREPMFYDDL